MHNHILETQFLASNRKTSPHRHSHNTMTFVEVRNNEGETWHCGCHGNQLKDLLLL